MSVTYHVDLCSKEDWSIRADTRRDHKRGLVNDRDASHLSRVEPGWELPIHEYNWNTNANGLATFVRESGRAPNKKAGEPRERRLGQWLSNQRTDSRKGSPSFTPVRHAYLDEHVPGWRSASYEERWWSTADDLAAFVRENGRMPKRGRVTKSAEKSLGHWLHLQRVGSREHALTADRRAYLDEHVPGWVGVSPEDQWRAVADDLAAFVRENGRMPSVASKESSEGYLARWRGTQRKAQQKVGAASLAPKRRAYLDEHVPGWDGGWQDRWCAVADDLAAFVRENGRLPRANGRRDLREKRLGGWVSKQRGNLRASTLAAERRAYLDRHVPGWGGISVEDQWLVNADDLSAFIREADRMPSTTARDSREKRLGGWVSKQRGDLRTSALAPERRTYLDKHVPGWDADPEARWRRLADDLADFVRANGRMPSRTAPDRGERALGSWLNNQKTVLRSGRTSLTPERRTYLDKHVPGWRGSRP